MNIPKLFWLSFKHITAMTVITEIPGMDPVFMAFSLFRRHRYPDMISDTSLCFDVDIYILSRYEECVESCTKLLEQNPYDEQIWSLKTRALTEQVHVCDVEADEEGIVDVVLDDNTIRAVPRPGTSLRTAQTQGVVSQAFR